MTESGPTQPADDLRARIATSLQFSFVGAEMDRRDTENVTLTVHDTEKAGDRLLAAVVGPYLARLREENAQLAADRADAVRGYEQERDAATAAHTRNLVLRSEHRTEVERLRAEYDQAVEDWGRNDEQVLADSARLAEENERLRAELVAIGAQRDDAEEERASMVRDLHAAVFDGSTLLPDRPLDTVWEYLLGCVRNDPARLSGGNTPSDAEIDRVALFLLRTKVYGTNASARCAAAVANQWDRHLTAEEREHWRTWARTLMSEAGWGSAVATPADTEQTNPSHGDLSGPRAQQLQGNPEQTIRPADTQADDGQLRTELLAWATVLARGTGSVPAVDVAWKLRQLAAPSVGADPEDEVLAELREDEKHHATFRPDLAGGAE